MTDAQPNYEDFPALDGPSNSNNKKNNIDNSTTNKASSSPTVGKKNIITKAPFNSSNSWSTSSQRTSSQQNTNSTGQQQNNNLNYLLLATNSQTQQHQPHIQQLYNQQPQLPTHHHHQHQQQQQQQHLQAHQQQVTNTLFADSPYQSPKNMSSQFHLQQQPHQPQQQQQQQSVNNNTITTNNNNNNNSNNNNNNRANVTNNTMQNNVSVQNKRSALPPNHITSSEKCCTFKIAPEERRPRDFKFERSKILKEIMQKTNTKIELTTTKDGALNFCIIGKENCLQQAKDLVLNDFQTTVTLTVSVPKSMYGRLLGPKGQRLAAIQSETQTKIAIPHKDDDSDIIKIVGLKSNAELAVKSIQKYVREFASKAMEKVSIERIYLLFITGAFNENLKRWEEMGAKVSTSGGLLPSNNDRELGHADEITFTIVGETNAVNQVKEEIIQIYEDKKKKSTTVNIEVKKAQHKYILGPGGQNLRNLFAKTGVSVELPHESESETITLRGERSKLAPALSELYTQAHSETDDFLEAETWLHKYLIGTRKINSIDFKSMGVEVKSLEDKIRLHGPPTEVENIKDVLESELKTIRKTIIRKDVKVEPRIHGYIIGRSGATVDQIREESGAYILVPKNDEPSEFITLEGTVEAVAIAEEKINAIAKRYEASRKLLIDQQLHGSIIGRGGEKIRSIREKFSNVVFTFPEQGTKNNEITILGPTDEVEECYKYLDEFHKQLQENNHQIKVPIKNDVVKYLQDAQSAIKRIKLDHRVKIDLFLTTNSNKVEVSNNITNSLLIDNNITSNENNDDKSSDSKKKVNKSKVNKKQQAASSPQKAQQENGVSHNSNSTNDKNKSSSDAGQNYALITGKKDDVDSAKAELSKLFDELMTTIELEFKISHKLRSLLGPKTKTYDHFLDEFHNKVVVTFPSAKQQQTKQQSQTNNSVDGAAGTNGAPTNVKSNKYDNIEVVKIRGPKNIVKKAEKRFEALINECQDKLDKNFKAHVMVDSNIIDKFSYSEKFKLNTIRTSHKVRLTIPDRRDNPKLLCSIVGYEKNVELAQQQFIDLVKSVQERIDETIEIPSQVHPRLIGAQGHAVKKLMEEFMVEIKFARQGDANPNFVTLSGKPEAVSAAKNRMMKLADQYLAAASRAGNNNTTAANTNSNTTTTNTSSSQPASELKSIAKVE